MANMRARGGAAKSIGDSIEIGGGKARRQRSSKEMRLRLNV